MSEYYNGACLNKVMIRGKTEYDDDGGLDAAEECNRLSKRIEELDRRCRMQKAVNVDMAESYDKRIEELEAQLNAIAGLNDYCLRTISIHRESTNIQLVEDIQTKLQTILRGEE